MGAVAGYNMVGQVKTQVQTANQIVAIHQCLNLAKSSFINVVTVAVVHLQRARIERNHSFWSWAFHTFGQFRIHF